MERDENGKAVFDDEYGELSCWYIAHQELWKKTFEEKTKAAAMSADGEKKHRKQT